MAPEREAEAEPESRPPPSDLRAQGPPRWLLHLSRADLVGRLESLAAEVDATRADRGFVALLDGISRLWRYSVLNHLFILVQHPGATAVAGRKAWEKQGRTIKAGARALVITAPSSPGRYVWVEVYDISQTDGPPVPERLGSAAGDCPELASIEGAPEVLGIELVELCESRIGVAPTGVPGSVMATSSGGRIAVRPGLSPLTRARAIVHELAHELLHQPQYLRKDKAPPKRPRPEPPRIPPSVEEAEADAAAYVVMQALGYRIESPTYIAWMGGSGDSIISSVNRLHAAARTILFAIHGEKRPIAIPPWRAAKR